MSFKYPLDIYFYEAFEEEWQQIAAYLPPNIKAGHTWKTIQETTDNQPSAPLISTRTQTIIPESWLIQVKGLLTRSTGFEYFQQLRKKAPSIVQFGYLPLYCNRSVAEQALLLWLAIMRKLPKQTLQFQTFNRDGLTGRESMSKTLLIVGIGNIGYEVVKIGRGLAMTVLGVDIVKKHKDVKYVDFDQTLPQADVIVSAMNLTPENTNYFNYQRLKTAKPGTIFINIARGEQSFPSALKRLLDEKILGGVALDVYPFENKLGSALRSNLEIEDSELKVIKLLAQYPNVILTPHNAFNTEESVQRKSEQSVQQTIHFLETGKFIWEVPD